MAFTEKYQPTKWLVRTVIAVAAVLLLYCLGKVIFQEDNWYSTNNISDYGKITGNGKNVYVEEFVKTFFPEKLEPYFDDIIYEYQVRQWCDYCCEIYLEFTIEDPLQFAEYHQATTNGLTGVEFPYDSRYTDYVVSVDLPLAVYRHRNKSGEVFENVYVEKGKMGRILVCPEEQKIIYTALMVTNCCGEAPESFRFYDRFGIDPFEYAQTYSSIRYYDME